MIIDRIENWKLYFNTTVWELAFKFLNEIKDDTEATKYPIQGDDVFARVMSYETRTLKESAFEAHENYIDIQYLTSGEELIIWHPIQGLEIADPYNDVKDVIKYQPQACNIGNKNILTPGIFAVYYPGDAHMPMVMSETSPCQVKKVVVKIKVS